MSVYLILSLLLLCHVICDFYVQTEKCVQRKKFPVSSPYDDFLFAHITHAMTHALVLTAVAVFWYWKDASVPQDFYSLRESFLIFFYIAIILFGSHFIIDLVKEYIVGKVGAGGGLISKVASHTSLIFLADQFLHVAVIFWVSLKFFYPIPFQNVGSNIHLELLTAIIFLMSLLLLLKPASIFIILFMGSKKIGGVPDKIRITKSFLSGAYYTELAKNYAAKDISTELHNALEESKKKADELVVFLKSGSLEISSSDAFDSNGAGKWIGYIERVMILVFFIFNQPAAIAGIMAIKTAFRFNDLKDDNDSARSEYIMIGTFLSFFITMIVAGIAKFSIESIWYGSKVEIMNFDILHWLNNYIFNY